MRIDTVGAAGRVATIFMLKSPPLGLLWISCSKLAQEIFRDESDSI